MDPALGGFDSDSPAIGVQRGPARPARWALGETSAASCPTNATATMHVCIQSWSCAWCFWSSGLCWLCGGGVSASSLPDRLSG